MKYCPECGQKIEGNPKFCPECANKLIADLKVNSDSKEKVTQKNKNNQIIIAVIAIAVIVICLFIILQNVFPDNSTAFVKVIYTNNADLEYTLNTKIGYRVSSETVMIRSDLGTHVVPPHSTVEFKGTVGISDRQTFDIFVYMQGVTVGPWVEKNGVTLHSGENEVYVSYP